MSITKQLNSKVNIKQYSNADVPTTPRYPVIARYNVDSTASQTVVNLPWTVDTLNAQDSFFISIDGKVLTLGSANDYTMTNVDSMGFSSQVTLTTSLVAGLNIQAWKLGLKKETEWAQDQRWVQNYEYLGDAFQGFINQDEFKLTATNSAPWSSVTYPGTFYSTIVGRKPIMDLSQDLKPRMGIERVMIQNLIQLQDEFGPNGEAVWSALNDDKGLIRFVGGWSASSTTSGTYFITTTANDFVEIVFYGTGLNLLEVSDGSARNYTASVDGGTPSSNLFSTNSSVLNSRNYATNMIRPLVSGLTLGLHTVKLQLVSGVGIAGFGFEILNESSSVKTNSGVGYSQGKKVVTPSQDITSYTSGVTGTKGGRTVIYQDTDGTIKRAWQATDTLAKAFSYAGTGYAGTAADHTNEEVVRTYHWREFGAGRTSPADDFSLSITTGSNYAFTLDDGTTTLVGSSIVNTTQTVDAIGLNATGSFITFTFVGTGLDIFNARSAVSDGISITIDGAVVSASTTFAANAYTKIVSGLPYGAHTVKITRLVGMTNNIGLTKLMVYQPKKPSVPTGTIELGDYNVMANYTTTTSTIVPSTGTLTKSQVREVIYTGSWATPVVTAAVPSGFGVSSSTNGDSISYTFFGTGFEFYAGAVSGATFTIQVDGANYTGTPTAVGAGITWSSPTVTLLGDNLIQILGLTLGLHTIKFTKTNTTTTSVYGFAFITPIHSPKSNLYADLQNTLPVGSCGISDNRKFTPVKEILPATKAWAQAVIVTSGPTTSSNIDVPMPDMSCTIKTSGGPLKISYSCGLQSGTAVGNFTTRIYVNGVAVGNRRLGVSAGAGYPIVMADSFILPVSSGTHKVDLYWSAPSATTLTVNERDLVVEEK